MTAPFVDIYAEIDLPVWPKTTEPMILGLMRAAATAGGELVRRTWERRARDLNVRHTGLYIMGITKNARIEVDSETEVGEGQYEIVVAITNTAEHASIVEEGHGAFHLPSRIDWSNAGRSIKRTKDGRPYLTIPLQHSAFIEPSKRTAGARSQGPTSHALKHMLPKEVHAEAKRLERSTARKEGPQSEIRISQGGLHVGGDPIRRGSSYSQHTAEDKYNWAKDKGRKKGTLRRPQGFHRPGQIIAGKKESWIETRGARGKNPAWQGSKFEGMRKMGPKGHPEYMTWRVITPDSKGWNIPALAGKHVAAQVAAATADVVGPFIEETFNNLLEERGLL